MKLSKGWQVDGCEWRYHVLNPVIFPNKLVIKLGKFKYFLLGRILGRSQEILFVVRIGFQMFDFLLTIKHLPTFDA